jgi:hypothetical protein
MAQFAVLASRPYERRDVDNAIAALKPRLDPGHRWWVIGEDPHKVWVGVLDDFSANVTDPQRRHRLHRRFGMYPRKIRTSVSVWSQEDSLQSFEEAQATGPLPTFELLQDRSSHEVAKRIALYFSTWGPVLVVNQVTWSGDRYARGRHTKHFRV